MEVVSELLGQDPRFQMQVRGPSEDGVKHDALYGVWETGKGYK